MDTTRLTATALLLGLLLVGCKNHVVYRELGFEDYRAGHYAEAAEDFREATNKKPSDYQSQYYLGAALLKDGQAIAAQTPLEQALDLTRDDPSWRPRVADSLAESYYKQGRIETLYGFLDDMVRTYHQQPVDYLRQAKYLGVMGDADGQRLSLQKAAYFAQPGDAEPYLAIADFYLTVNDVPNTIQALRYGHYVQPDNEEIKNRLRGLGVVPGPTAADVPPKPELIAPAPEKPKR